MILEEVIKINQDSIKLVETIPEHLVGKRIFDHCMEFYKSERLDSILKKEIPKWKEIKNIQKDLETYTNLLKNNRNKILRRTHYISH